jgi:uncharacterized membrane protein
MRPTRKIIAEFVAVFLIGAIAGALVMRWTFTESQVTTFMNKTADKPEAMVARMNKRYTDEHHLSPEELQKIQPTLLEMAQNIYQIRRQFGTDMIAALDKYHQQIAEQLTPEHRAAYEQAMADHRKNLSAALLPDQSSPSPETK